MASKILAEVAHEWAGISKVMEEILRVVVQACRGWHRLNPAKSRLPFPRLVVIPLINEVIRLGNLAAAPATALTFALCLRSPEALVSRPGGVPSASGRPSQVLEHPSAHPRPVGQPRVQVPRAYAHETPGSGRGAGSSRPPLSRLDGSVYHRSMQSAVREARSASALPVTTGRRVPRSFCRLSRRDGSAEKGPLGQLQWAMSVREGCPHPTTAPSAFVLRASVVRGLSPKVGSAAAGLLWNGVRNATEEIIPLLGSGAALMARQWKCTRSWSTLTCLAFGRQSGVTSFGADALQRHVRGLSRSRRRGGLALSTDGKNFSSVPVRLAAFGSLLVAALWHSAKSNAPIRV